jgi:hypothetical protein
MDEYEFSSFESKKGKKDKVLADELKNLNFIEDDVKEEAVKISNEINCIKRSKKEKDRFEFCCVLKAYENLNKKCDIPFLTNKFNLDKNPNSYKSIIGRFTTDNCINSNKNYDIVQIFFDELENLSKDLKLKDINKIKQIIKDVIEKDKSFLNDNSRVFVIGAIYASFFINGISLKDEAEFFKIVGKTKITIKKKSDQIITCLSSL